MSAAPLPVLPIVVIGSPVSSRRQERARRHCLDALLFELAAAGVAETWLESRNTLLDRRDLDVVAGAVSAAEGVEPTYRRLLDRILTEHRIRLD